jgi:Mg/Co/Ni transporter MgtE
MSPSEAALAVAEMPMDARAPVLKALSMDTRVSCLMAMPAKLRRRLIEKQMSLVEQASIYLHLLLPYTDI